MVWDFLRGFETREKTASGNSTVFDVKKTTKPNCEISGCFVGVLFGSLSVDFKVTSDAVSLELSGTALGPFSKYSYSDFGCCLVSSRISFMIPLVLFAASLLVSPPVYPYML